LVKQLVDSIAYLSDVDNQYRDPSNCIFDNYLCFDLLAFLYILLSKSFFYQISYFSIESIVIIIIKFLVFNDF
uniref:Ovule protein n=1 Tax=Strongyloides venezuelensis TaxID=75913 RepID=A0A0K0FLW7_STRVS